MPINFDLKAIREKYNLHTFFETGLYKGKSIDKAIAAGFEKAISVEISTIHITAGHKKFRDEIESGKVVLVQDDSKNLGDHLALSEGNVFFWLDAHADQGAKHERGAACPLYAELDAIAGSVKSGDVIAIDDMRLLKGGSWGSNVTYKKVMDIVNSIGVYDIQFLEGIKSGDVLVAFPRID